MNGKLKINNEDTTWDGLGPRMEQIFKERAEKIAFVKGDNDVMFMDVARAIDIMRGAGIDKIGLITAKLEAASKFSWVCTGGAACSTCFAGCESPPRGHLLRTVTALRSPKTRWIMGMLVGGKRGIVSDMNVVPLIDILLVLLVIFMIIPCTPRAWMRWFPSHPPRRPGWLQAKKSLSFRRWRTGRCGSIRSR